MSSIVTADIHQTENTRDAHRWGLIPWLGTMAREHKAKEILILGDLTDAKDRHSSELVNRFVTQVYNVILDYNVRVCIMKGNHDAQGDGTPFFEFLHNMPGVTFITEPMAEKDRMFLPSTRTWEKDWADLDFKGIGQVFTHATFDGVLTENGTRLSGIPTSVFKGFKGKVWAGDIHVPQMIGKKIEYVGAPYRVDFGDNYDPRVLLLGDDGTPRNLFFPCKNKHLVVVRRSEELKAAFTKQYVEKGDQVKVRVLLERGEYPTWPEVKAQVRAYCDKREVELYGPELRALNEVGVKPTSVLVSSAPSPEDAFERYVKAKRLPKELVAVGRKLLKDAA